MPSHRCHPEFIKSYINYRFRNSDKSVLILADKIIDCELNTFYLTQIVDSIDEENDMDIFNNKLVSMNNVKNEETNDTITDLDDYIIKSHISNFFHASSSPHGTSALFFDEKHRNRSRTTTQ